MKISNTSSRLKELMAERKLRQIDILNAAKPFCIQYGVKLEKNDLSQYVNGKVEPGQEKLTILGLALNVSETWLMGYDVTPSRIENNLYPVRTESIYLSPEEEIIICKFRVLDSRGQSAVLNVLNYEYDSLVGEKAVSTPKEA